jgi:hypothetical protein
MSGSGTKYLSASIANGGTITLTGTLQFNGYNLQIVNQSLFDVPGDAAISSGGYSGLQISNAGTFRKSAGTNACTVNGLAFQNTGTLSVWSGTVDLQSGGTLAGNLTASNAAALTFSGGTFTLSPGAVFSGSGFVGVAGGSPTFAGTLGTTLGWTGGTVGGNWTIAANGMLAMNGPGIKYLAGWVTNSGTVTLAGMGLLQFADYNLWVINQVGALFDVPGDAGISSGGYTGLQITNAGTFRKSAGTNTCGVNGVVFQNTGTLSALGPLTCRAAGCWPAIGQHPAGPP